MTVCQICRRRPVTHRRLILSDSPCSPRPVRVEAVCARCSLHGDPQVRSVAVPVGES